MKGLRWGVLLLGASGWVLYEGLSPRMPMVPAAMPASTPGDSTAAGASAPGASSAATGDAGQQRLADSSLRGTEPDGAWTVGTDGRLRADLSLRRRLDHHLTLQGNVPLEQVGAALAEEVAGLHGPQAAADLRRLWGRYLALQQYPWKHTADPSRPHTLSAALEERLQVRRELLGPAVAEAFFRQEDDRLREDIARWNGGAAATASADMPLLLEPPAAGDALLQQHQLRQSWNSWEKRLSDARSEQLRLHDIPGWTAAQRQAAMQAHLQANFSASELPQVEALLRLMPP